MKKWNVLSEFNNTSVVECLLQSRGITNAPDFINPPSLTQTFSEFSGEFKKSLKDASDLVLEFIKTNKPIIIHGDYDADGICATAILYNTIKKELNCDKVYYFIPNRFDHGYGLSQKSIEECLKIEGVEDVKEVLFVTVDSGITAIEEVATLKRLGHKIIITDHHQKSAEVPLADALVWNDEMVGSGISWLLSKVLGSKDLQSVALAALATVTDLQPLLGFNRSLVKKGLEVINKNPPFGIKRLLELSGRKSTEVSTYDLGWVLGPRLNASGRMVDANQALSVLIEEDVDKVNSAALSLNAVNIVRQDKTLEMYRVASGFDENNLPKILVSSSSDYHEGIIGLVASKLVQKYFRPSIVISLNDGLGKGSVRSIRGINIINLLRRNEDLFESLGGHPMAAGFTIKKENILVLEEKLLELAEHEIPDDLLQETLDIDVKIPLHIVNLDLLAQLDLLKPYGLGNEEPVFLSENVGLTDLNHVGRDKQHVQMKLYKDGQFLKGMYFNGSELVKDLGFGDKIDVVYTISKNEYNGSTSVDLFIKDFRKL